MFIDRIFPRGAEDVARQARVLGLGFAAAPMGRDGAGKFILTCLSNNVARVLPRFSEELPEFFARKKISTHPLNRYARKPISPISPQVHRDKNR
jgi:hypothetical protein